MNTKYKRNLPKALRIHLFFFKYKDGSSCLVTKLYCINVKVKYGSKRRLTTLTPPTEEQHLIYRTMLPVLRVDSAHSVTGIKAAFNSDSPLSATVSSTESYDMLLRIYRMYNMTFLKVCTTGIKISTILHVA
jgi:hypothetical protein